MPRRSRSRSRSDRRKRSSSSSSSSASRKSKKKDAKKAKSKSRSRSPKSRSRSPKSPAKEAKKDEVELEEEDADLSAPKVEKSPAKEPEDPALTKKKELAKRTLAAKGPCGEAIAKCLDELCALPGAEHAVVLGPAACGFYRDGAAVDVCLITAGVEEAKEGEEPPKRPSGPAAGRQAGLMRLQKSRLRQFGASLERWSAAGEGALDTGYRIDVHVHVNDYAAVVRTQLLQEYCGEEKHLALATSELLQWAKRRHVNTHLSQYSDAILGWSLVAALVDAKDVPKPSKTGLKALFDDGFPDAAALEGAARKFAADPPDVPEAGKNKTKALVVLKTGLEYLAKRATGAIGLHGSDASGIEDPVTGQLAKPHRNDAIALRREAMREVGVSDKCRSEAKQMSSDERKALCGEDEAGVEGAWAAKWGGLDGLQSHDTAKALSPSWLPGMPTCVMSSRRKVTAKCDVRVAARTEGQAKVMIHAVALPLDQKDVLPWDDLPWATEEAMARPGGGEFELEIDINTAKAAADKTPCGVYVCARDTSRGAWATTPLVRVKTLNCPEEIEKEKAAIAARTSKGRFDRPPEEKGKGKGDEPPPPREEPKAAWGGEGGESFQRRDGDKGKGKGFGFGKKGDWGKGDWGKGWGKGKFDDGKDKGKGWGKGKFEGRRFSDGKGRDGPRDAPRRPRDDGAGASALYSGVQVTPRRREERNRGRSRERSRDKKKDRSRSRDRKKSRSRSRSRSRRRRSRSRS